VSNGAGAFSCVAPLSDVNNCGRTGNVCPSSCKLLLATTRLSFQALPLQSKACSELSPGLFLPPSKTSTYARVANARQFCGFTSL
jgi:hypothetical protein